MITEHTLEDALFEIDDLKNTISDLQNEIKYLNRDLETLDSLYKLKNKGLSLIHKDGIWEIRDGCGVLASSTSPLEALKLI